MPIEVFPGGGGVPATGGVGALPDDNDVVYTSPEIVKPPTSITSYFTPPNWPVWSTPPSSSPAGSGTVVIASSSAPSTVGPDGYIPVTQYNFMSAQEAAQSGMEEPPTFEDAWNMLVTNAGIDALGVPTNWWPGIDIPNIDEALSNVAPNVIPFLDGGVSTPGDLFDAFTEDWAAPSKEITFTEPGTDRTADFWVRYDPTRAAQQYMLMGAAERAKYSEMLVHAGLLDEVWSGIADFDPEPAAAFAQALAWANYYGKPLDEVLADRARLADVLRARSGGSGSGSGAGPTYQIEVPDYKTMVADAKTLLKNKLGRDPKRWEMQLVADEMQRQYGDWADATKARMLGGNGTYKIPDPNKLTEQFVDRTYHDEISRMEDVGDTRTTNQLLINAATKGSSMVGVFGG